MGGPPHSASTIQHPHRPKAPLHSLQRSGQGFTTGAATLRHAARRCGQGDPQGGWRVPGRNCARNSACDATMTRCRCSHGAPQVQALALQQQRAFAEKAVAADFDWDAVGELVHSEEGKREITALRGSYVDIRDRLENLAKVRAQEMRSVGTAPAVCYTAAAAGVRRGGAWHAPGQSGAARPHSGASLPATCRRAAQDPGAINWATWKKEIDPALVDGFKRAFESEQRAAVVGCTAAPSARVAPPRMRPTTAARLQRLLDGPSGAQLHAAWYARS